MPWPVGPHPVPPPRGRLEAVVRGLCPRCRQGPIFAGFLRMNRTCPVCGLAFEREQGYFTGAMYVSYALAVPLYAACVLGARLVQPGARLERDMLLAAIPFTLLAPLLFRASRVLWIHLDRAIDRSPD